MGWYDKYVSGIFTSTNTDMHALTGSRERIVVKSAGLVIERLPVPIPGRSGGNFLC